MPGNKPQAGLTTADLVGLAQESMRLLTPCGESIAPLLMNGHREMTDTPKPTEISLHQKSRVLEIAFEDGARFELPYEFLRVHSPSAEVQGHGPGQGVLQIGKEDVTITKVDPVGNYAIQPYFDDGHDTGIYQAGSGRPQAPGRRELILPWR
jgi:DUF971 family protein